MTTPPLPMDAPENQRQHQLKTIGTYIGICAKTIYEDTTGLPARGADVAISIVNAAIIQINDAPPCVKAQIIFALRQLIAEIDRQIAEAGAADAQPH